MAKKILIVEDEPKNLKLMRDLLQRFSFETVEAVDGEQGVALSKSAKPDLILMDIMMPKMDGLEASRLIKADAATAHIPIIALTSFAMKGDRERTIEAGCDGYIAKPVDIAEVLKSISQLLARYERVLRLHSVTTAPRFISASFQQGVFWGDSNADREFEMALRNDNRLRGVVSWSKGGGCLLCIKG